MPAPIYPRDAARLLGVHVKTLQRWDAEGRLIAKRTATNRHYYTQDQIDTYLDPPRPAG